MSLGHFIAISIFMRRIFLFYNKLILYADTRVNKKSYINEILVPKNKDEKFRYRIGN